MMRRIFAVAVVAAVGLSGCASKREAPAPAPVESRAAPAAVDTGSSIRPGSSEDFRVNVGDTVTFDYDRYSVDADAQAALQRQAAWLNKYPAVMLTIEGYCDERGTREYNLALGARRAQAIREYLVSHGVSTNRLDTISYGKERPICSESTKGCWSKNRRGVSAIRSGAES
jgi:peptidoglycan-associated lipoprotein